MWPFKKKEEQPCMDTFINYKAKMKEETQDLMNTIKKLEDKVRKLEIENRAMNYRKEDLKKSANLYLQRAEKDIDKNVEITKYQRACFPDNVRGWVNQKHGYKLWGVNNG